MGFAAGHFPFAVGRPRADAAGLADGASPVRIVVASDEACLRVLAPTWWPPLSRAVAGRPQTADSGRPSPELELEQAWTVRS